MKLPSLTATVVGLVGAACMGWGGSSIEHLIGADGGNLSVPVFAIGVVLLGQLPAVALRQRVKDLEARLSSQSTAT